MGSPATDNGSFTLRVFHSQNENPIFEMAGLRLRDLCAYLSLAELAWLLTYGALWKKGEPWDASPEGPVHFTLESEVPTGS